VSPVDAALLVVAKAPVPGLAKTRLAASIGPEAAAELAAAAMVDTLMAVRDAEVSTRIVALTGDLKRACRSDELVELLAACIVIGQTGAGLGERLAAAHRDAAHIVPGPVLQIGMDTPQVTPALLTEAAGVLADGEADAVFGPASDGGWWALGMANPNLAGFLAGVAMSQDDTGSQTLDGLRRVCRSVTELATLTDVDTIDDVWSVASGLDPDSRFRQAAEAARATNW
jgi:glycosyltransferase A (GT-A) superfamily protein (DUF2064 family)